MARELRSWRRPKAEPMTTTTLSGFTNNTTAPTYLVSEDEDEFDAPVIITRMTDHNEADFNSDHSLVHLHASLPAFIKKDGVDYYRTGDSLSTWRHIDTNDGSVVGFTYSQGEGRILSKVSPGRAYWYYSNTILYATHRDYDSLTGGTTQTNMIDFSDSTAITGLTNVYTNMQFNSSHFNLSHSDVGCMVGTTDGTDVWLVTVDMDGLFGDPDNGGTYVLHEEELTWLDWANNYSGADGLRWVKTSLDGNYNVIGYFTDETTRETDFDTSTRGIWVYPVGTTTVAAGSQLTIQRNHSCLAINAAGDQVMVTNDFGYRGYQDNTSTVVTSNGNARYLYEVSEIRLSDAVVTGLYWEDAVDPHWGYTSGENNVNRPGYCSFSYSGNATDAGNNDAALLLGMWHLDGGDHATLGTGEASFEPWTRIYSDQADGAARETPHGVSNSDGTKIAYRANYSQASLNPSSTCTGFIAQCQMQRRNM